MDQLLAQSQITSTGLLYNSEAKNFNQWLFERIRKYIKGNVLEIRSGGGNLSDLFIKHKIPIYLSDRKTSDCRMLNERYGKEPLVQNIFNIDLLHTDFEHQYKGLIGELNTIIALNILEHRPSEKLAILNAKSLLRQRGHLILLTPASTALYNGLDHGLERWKTYNQESIEKILTRDFEILRTQYFNMVGIAGWWLSGYELNKRKLPSDEKSEYEKLVPFFRISGSMTFNQEGLSVIVIGEKK